MYDMIANLLRSGRNGGAWNGTSGIRSATALNNAARTTGPGRHHQRSGQRPPSFTAPSTAKTVDNNAILVKYTYNGDANEDGMLNADDYAAIDAGFASHATGYNNGDFNFSGGSPNPDDYFIIDKTFNDQGAPLSDPIPAAAAASETIERARVLSVTKQKGQSQKAPNQDQAPPPPPRTPPGGERADALEPQIAG